MQRRKRQWIGKVALLATCKEEMLVHVHDVRVYIDGWYAKMSNAKDPDSRTFRIGPFRWDDPAFISRDCWTFPKLLERYDFDRQIVDDYLRKHPG